MSTSEMDYTYIACDEEFIRLCEQWQQSRYLALDTEFMRSRTFYPHLGLLQIADAFGVYIIDPLAITDKSCFAKLLRSPNITWVIHSCTEDLETLEHFYGAIPAVLFDTQLAAHFAGLGDSLGYAGLVEALEGEVIPKEQTRSDWFKRPLSTAQLSYAALDVKFLLSIREQLTDRLSTQNKLEWFEQECEFFIYRTQLTTEYYLRVNSAWKLSSKQLALLKALCQWREKIARELDRPRNHVIDSQSLWEIAAKAPAQVKNLHFINKLNDDIIAKYGGDIVEIVESIESLNPNEYPPRLPKPLGQDSKKQLKLLQAINIEQANSHQLSPSLLCRKKDFLYFIEQAQNNNLESLLVEPGQLPEHLSSWRYELITKALIMASQDFQTLSQGQD